MIMESTGMHKKKVVTSAIALTFAAIVSTQAVAQTDLQAPTPPQPLQVRPSALPAAPLATQASVPAASGTSVELQSVEITGNRNIDTATLLAALGDVKGRRLDAAGLKALSDRVTATYTAAGYVFASAFLPPQNLQNGVLRLTVIEGQYGRVRATSSDPDLAAQAQAFLDHGLKTGAHFNPDGHPHNDPSHILRHAGAMFNIKADADGVGTTRQEVDTITLTPGRYSIIGMPIITHRDPDDYVSQPLGNAGPRVSCGIIKLESVVTAR